MRTINADGLLNLYSGLKEDDRIMVGQVRADINAMPTVNPIKHAHWIPECPNKRTGKAFTHTCSECGITVYDERQVTIDELEYTFCPNCGAKMDEVMKNE